MKWFGKAWNPRVCVAENEISTPVGEKCPKCTSHIEEGDQGVILLCAKSIDIEKELCEVVAEAWHLDCFLKTMLPPDLFKKHVRATGVSNSGKN